MCFAQNAARRNGRQKTFPRQSKNILSQRESMSNAQRWKTKERLVRENFFGQQKIYHLRVFGRNSNAARASALLERGKTTTAFSGKHQAVRLAGAQPALKKSLCGGSGCSALFGLGIAFPTNADKF